MFTCRDGKGGKLRSEALKMLYKPPGAVWSGLERFIFNNYYMALSHKDWELPNPRIWLAETDIDRGLDFPI